MAFVPRGNEVDSSVQFVGWLVKLRSQQEVVVAEPVRPGSSSRKPANRLPPP